jgi:hypothetical protein
MWSRSASATTSGIELRIIAAILIVRRCKRAMSTAATDLRYPIGPSRRRHRPQMSASAPSPILPRCLAISPRPFPATRNNSTRHTGPEAGGASVVHHIADSHVNAFVRLKLALTEDRPTISADERKFADLPIPRCRSASLGAAARPARPLGGDLQTDDRR